MNNQYARVSILIILLGPLQGCFAPSSKDTAVSVLLNSNNLNPIINEELTVTWSTKNASYCNAEGAWSGAKSLYGSQTLYFSTSGEKSLTLECGNNMSKSTESLLIQVDLPTPFTNSFPENQGVDIIAIYGQSNAVGRANILEEDKNLNEQTQAYKKCLDENGVLLVNVDCGDFFELSHPTDIYGFGGHSAWPRFVGDLKKNQWRQIIFANAAVGNTNLKQLMKGDKTPISFTTERYSNLIWAIQKSITLAERELVNTLSIIWLQGENDAQEITEGSQHMNEINQKFITYFKDLNTLREDILRDSGADKIYFFIVRVGNYFPSANQPHINPKIINDLGYWQIEFSCQNDNFQPLSVLPKYFEDDQMLDDGIHYSRLSNLKLGEDMAANFTHIQRGNNFEYICQNNLNFSPMLVFNRPF